MTKFGIVVGFLLLFAVGWFWGAPVQDEMTEAQKARLFQQAQEFYQLALDNKCQEADRKLLYPVIMSGMGIHDFEKWKGVCGAIETSGRFRVEHDKKRGTLVELLTVSMPAELLRDHPLLKVHVPDQLEDVKFYLVESWIDTGTPRTNKDEEKGGSIIFRCGSKSCRIIMFEDYRLSTVFSKRRDEE
ncbi:MAG: hypothetical protein HQL53_06875 [Magnetococcales bacterium]|nr:hypothetical protein [Magnetococcales bacterium]